MKSEGEALIYAELPVLSDLPGIVHILLLICIRIGPDWKSKLRWLPSPEAGTSESAQFVEIWPESWRGLRTFPGRFSYSFIYAFCSFADSI